MIKNYLQQGSNFVKKVAGKAGAVTGIKQVIGSRLAAAGLPLAGEWGRQESALSSQSGSPSATKDWAVTITTPVFDELMADSDILQPLSQAMGDTGQSMKGIRFPVTPAVFMSHSASYDAREVLHNNYPYYAYQNSRVDQMTINGSFPVQDTKDGLQWLATVHFLRTVTKMYYGSGNNQGNPPPICKLNGYGDYVFQNVSVIITNFTVDLRSDVDYIAVNVESQKGFDGGTIEVTDLETLPGVSQGTVTGASSNSYSPIASTVQSGSVNYVPTDSMITVQCIPIYSRSKISNKFNLKSFADGKLAKDGFI